MLESLASNPRRAFRKIARENVKKNDFDDVEILPYAISDTDEKTFFNVSSRDSMAGSLTDRRRAGGDDIESIEVQCRRLSHYLDEPIHFLKLDIEGAEDKVLEEAAEHLKNVEHLFCEYHHGNGLPLNRLAKILAILDEAGFEVHVGPPSSIRQYTRPQPLSFLKKPYSALLWAKNLNWNN